MTIKHSASFTITTVIFQKNAFPSKTNVQKTKVLTICNRRSSYRMGLIFMQRRTKLTGEKKRSEGLLKDRDRESKTKSKSLKDSGHYW